MSAATGSVSSFAVNESVARVQGDEALAGQIQTLSATVSANTAAIDSEATTRADAVSALAATQETLIANFASGGGSGNLVANSDLQGDDGWFFYAGAAGSTSGLNLPGWYPPNGVPGVLWASYAGTPAANDGLQWNSPPCPVTAGKTYEVSIYAAFHRMATVQIFVTIFDANGNATANQYLSSGGTSYDVTGTAAQNGNIANFQQIGSFYEIPAGTSYVAILAQGVTDGTEASPYVFLTRPQIKLATAGQPQLSTYTPGTQANVPAITASITQEATARATADEAISDTVASLSATVGGNTSAISSEAVTRSDADSALSATIDTLSSTVDGNTSAITNEATTRSDADESLAGQISQTSAAVGANATSIQAETVARVDGDSALGALINSLTSTVDANTAAIQSEAVARSDADQALSDTIETVSAVAGRQHIFFQPTPPAYGGDLDVLWVNTAAGNVVESPDGQGGWVPIQDTGIAASAAAITTEQAARAAADESLAGQITSVLTLTDGNAATIQTETIARTDADSALSDDIANLSSEVGSNAAAISSESVARATADQALSTSITSVSSTVDGNTASIQQISESLNGVLVQYGLIGTIDGETGGLILTGAALPGGGAVFDLIIKANVEIDGDLLLAGTLDQGALNATSAGDLASPRNVQAYTSGSGTFTVPAGVYWLEVELWGGGGGATLGCAGAGGGYAFLSIPVTPGQTFSYVVGAGGTANPSGYSGGTGGTTSFGSVMSATGGTTTSSGGNPASVPGLGSGGSLTLGGALGSSSLTESNTGAEEPASAVGGGAFQSSGSGTVGSYPGGGGGVTLNSVGNGNYYNGAGGLIRIAY